MKNRAIFIDRDGTLNLEVGPITNLNQFRLYEFAGQAINMINDAGIKAIVITNQSGVARGLYTEEFLEQVHSKMKYALVHQEAKVDAIYYCPHHKDIGDPPYRLDCFCRKPKPGLILKAADDLNLDLENSWSIGDRYRDVEAAHAAGVRSILILTGHGEQEDKERNAHSIQPDIVTDNLLEAVRLILSF